MRSRFGGRYGLAVAAAALAALCVSGGPVAQNAAAPPATATEKRGPEEVHGSAKVWKTSWGAKKTVLMQGDVVFTHGDTVIRSDEVTWDEEAKVATSPGKIAITDPEIDISGDKGTGYFKKRLGVVEGSVVMTLKPRDGEEPADGESIRGKLTRPTTITCAKLEYAYRTKVATATGGVVFKQKDRTARADRAVYDHRRELLTLSGNVRGEDEYRQTFSAPGTVIISLKRGDEWMEAEDANASFKIDLDSEETEDTKPGE